MPGSSTETDVPPTPLNARDGGSIQGCRSIGSLLAPIPTWHRALGLDPKRDAGLLPHARPGGVHARRRHAARDHEGQHSAIEVFDVNALGGASLHPVVASLPGAVRFAATVDSAGNLAVTEAGASAVAIFRSDDSTLTQCRRSPPDRPPGAGSSGWATPCTRRTAGSGTLSEVRDAPGEPLALQGTVVTDSGTVDAAASSDGRPPPVGSVTLPGAVGREGVVAG